MEGNDTKPCSRRQNSRRIAERRLQVVQLLIDGNTKRLKCSGRAMDAAPPIITGNRRFNYGGQLTSAGQWLLTTGGHNGPRNATGIPFFAKAVNHVCQVG